MKVNWRIQLIRSNLLCVKLDLNRASRSRGDIVTDDTVIRI